MHGAANSETLVEIWPRPDALDIVKLESNLNLSVSDTSLKCDKVSVGY